MSDEQKFLEVLKEIGRVLKDKNDEIIVSGFRESNLTKRLADAEKTIAELRKENTT